MNIKISLINKNFNPLASILIKNSDKTIDQNVQSVLDFLPYSYTTKNISTPKSWMKIKKKKQYTIRVEYADTKCISTTTSIFAESDEDAKLALDYIRPILSMPTR